MTKLTEGLVLAFNTASGKTYALSKSPMKLIKVNNDIIDAFFKVKYKWSVVVSVLARAESGEVQVVSRQAVFSRRMRKSQLAPHLAQLHSCVGDDVRYNYPGWELEDAAWMADPAGADWSEEAISQALKSINC